MRKYFSPLPVGFETGPHRSAYTSLKHFSIEEVWTGTVSVYCLAKG